MAVRGERTARSAPRVPLARSGGKGGGKRNVRRAPKVKREIHVSWGGVRSLLAGVAFFVMLAAFFVGVSFCLVYAYRYCTTSPYFALKTIEIQGNTRLSSREVLEIAGLTEGVNTLALSIDDVEAALKANSWVEGVSVQRVLPDTLIVGVKEYVPAFWRQHNGLLHYADERGNVIAPVVLGKFASLPTLEVEPGAEDSTGALPDLVRSLRESHLSVSMGSVSWVRLSASRGVEVFVDNDRLKISIGLEEWMANLRRLELTLADLGRRGELSEVREIRAQGSNVWVEKTASIMKNG